MANNDLTVLEMVQTAATELGLNAPTAVVHSQDLQVKQLLALMNRDANDLYRSRNWTFLSGEHIVNIAPPAVTTGTVTLGSTQITNIADASAFADGYPTSWSISGAGMPTAQRLTAITSGAPGAGIVTTEMECIGPSASGVTLTFAKDTYTIPTDFDRFISHTWWDRTNHWMLIGPTSPQFDQWQRSGITTVGPRLRWRQIGVRPTVFRLFPPPSAQTVPDALVFEYVNDGWAVHIDGSGNITYGNKFTADTDTTLLDDQALILGCKWRMWQIKGFSYAALQQEYADYVNRLKARDGGMPDLDMTRRKFPYLISSANVQDGNFPGS